MRKCNGNDGEITLLYDPQDNKTPMGNSIRKNSAEPGKLSDRSEVLTRRQFHNTKQKLERDNNKKKVNTWSMDGKYNQS